MKNERLVGTVSRGIRCPIIREGDDLAALAVNSVLAACESEGFELRDRDVIALTESIVARAQGNYASVEDIANDVRAKLGGDVIGVIFPILSRNRFAICLRGIAMGAKKVVLMLSYPSDEVGNALVSLDKLDEAGVNPYSDVLTLERYRELFGENKHEFTGVDYVEYYSQIIKDAGADVEIVFANRPTAILSYTDKYCSSGTKNSEGMRSVVREIPANLPEDVTERIRSLAVETFRALSCDGLSRIDFMIDEADGSIYVNEINTIPGSLSSYLWEYTGMTFQQVIDRLVELAFARSREENMKVTDFGGNIFAMMKGAKGAKGAKGGKFGKI